jgi:hypothetical protein
VHSVTGFESRSAAPTSKKRDAPERSRLRLRSYGRQDEAPSTGAMSCTFAFAAGVAWTGCSRSALRQRMIRERGHAMMILSYGPCPILFPLGCTRACIPALSGLALNSLRHRSSSFGTRDVGTAQTRFKTSVALLGAKPLQYFTCTEFSSQSPMPIAANGP